MGMRIDRYWKQAAAGLLAMMMFMTEGGGLDSLSLIHLSYKQSAYTMENLNASRALAQASYCLLYTSRCV